MTVTAASTETAIPGYEAATWTIDPVHSEVGFSVRHMMVSKVRGRFTSFSGQLVTGEDPAAYLVGHQRPVLRQVPGAGPPLRAAPSP